MSRLIVPTNTPVDVLDGIHLNTSASFSVDFEFEGPVTSIKIRGGLLVGGDPLNPPTYQIQESLSGDGWTNLGNDTWTVLNTYTTLGLGRFRLKVINTPYNGNLDWHLSVLGL